MLKVPFIIFTSLLLSVAHAGESSTKPKEAEPVTYKYGMDLDISRVISAGDIERACGLVPAVMVYEDSQGARHSLEYSAMGTASECSDN
ncbi:MULTISPECIES: DUF2790 domain-containing protein [Pseudomonas]|jgi:hypothetical protein|uniref:DUF2790 domain-containing protein n=1 Tax=Pseudomonas TaxID=286 RepID=UPI000C2A2948|nr:MULTISPECIES: DUF2790 domain-containing protein [Pseudomonas]PJX08547.1 DUF2790 domain-containing protein [Pseudomonas putida]